MSDTAKKKVKRKFPAAFAKEGLLSGRWYIHRSPINKVVLGSGDTAPKAWKDAVEANHL